MSDYIERQAAIDAIHCDITITGRQNAELVASTIGAFVDRIKALPSADVTPVVRCDDCKFRENDDFCTGRGFPYQLVPDDGFCDKGKRKE